MFLRKVLFDVFRNHIVAYPTPAGLNYLWGFGSLAGLMLASQIITGILLAMHYCPNVELAFLSVEHIMRDVNNGWLLRYCHANGASFFFLFVYIHLGRSFLYGLFTASRKYLWFSGLVLFILMMAIAFMGYVLPWGQMSFWGATVITNLFSALPFIGERIAFWLWGGFAVGNATLTRFFSFHYALPFVLLGVVGLHLALLHQIGSTSPLGSTKNTDKIAFYPYFYIKDYFGTLVWLIIFLSFVFYSPDILGHSDNYIEADALVTPTHIVPEWYFLPYYALLRSIPNKLGGVLAMALSLMVCFILPFYVVALRSTLRQGRFVYNLFIWIFFYIFILLGFLGGQPIEEPYTIFTQILAMLYFCFFFYFCYK
jgi:quinol-cytochrome oxidoreductase complex cytochrome b subunit